MRRSGPLLARVPRLGATLLLGFALAACGATQQTTSTPAAASPSVVATVAPSATGTSGTTEPAQITPASPPTGVAVPAALDFPATLVGGQQVDLGAYAGRPVAFWFWAPT